MELREIMLILHIIGAGTWLGANMVQFAVSRPASLEGPKVAAAWSRMAANMGTKLYMPAGLLVLLSGVVLVVDSDVYTFGSRFVTIGMAAVIIGAVLGPTVFGPGGHKHAEAVEAGDEATARRIGSRITRFALLDTLVVILAIVVMVLRWV